MTAAPARSEERISAVDVLRGVAVLGILLINIEDFGLLHSDKSAAGTEWVGAYLPSGYGPGTVAVWVAGRALFEGKMRALFSMLFGAGVVLLTSRLERRDPARVADVYFRRTLWLLAFGVLHAYLLWEGDILYSYALAGLFLFPFRRLSARALLAAGAAVLAISIPRAAVVAHQRAALRDGASRSEAALAAGRPLSKDEEEARSEWEEIVQDFEPDAATVQATLDTYRGGYLDLFERRAGLVRYVESSDFYGWAFFDTAGMMLLGMGLLRRGVLDGSRSRSFYVALLAIGYGVGLPLAAASAHAFYRYRFDPVAVAWLTAAYDPARVAVALGHVAVVMLVVRSKALPRATATFAAVGRMALTNYLFASLVCTTLFNGYGFGLFGSLRRRELYLVVLAVWAVELAASRAWLSAFAFGPAEWLWRSLTYWKRQPWRLDRAETPTAASATPAADT